MMWYKMYEEWGKIDLKLLVARICKTLNCDISDILIYTPPEK